MVMCIVCCPSVTTFLLFVYKSDIYICGNKCGNSNSFCCRLFYAAINGRKHPDLHIWAGRVRELAYPAYLTYPVYILRFVIYYPFQFTTFITNSRHMACIFCCARQFDLGWFFCIGCGTRLETTWSL